MIAFAKDREGRWRLFPNHLLIEHKGKVGIYIRSYWCNPTHENGYEAKMQLLEQFNHLFRKEGTYWPDEFWPIKEEYYDSICQG